MSKEGDRLHERAEAAFLRAERLWTKAFGSKVRADYMAAGDAYQATATLADKAWSALWSAGAKELARQARDLRQGAEDRRDNARAFAARAKR